MDSMKIIEKYYDKDSLVYNALITHSKAVAKKAIEVAKRVPELNPDIKFIEEASMLHDIGIYLTKATNFGCFGEKNYIEHGIIGRQILEQEGLPRHALVCERHIGTGLSAQNIKEQKLPLPSRDMIPETIDEEIVSFADLFFSKRDINNLEREKSVEEIRKELGKYSVDKVKRFNDWLIKFKEK